MPPKKSVTFFVASVLAKTFAKLGETFKFAAFKTLLIPSTVTGAPCAESINEAYETASCYFSIWFSWVTGFEAINLINIYNIYKNNKEYYNFYLCIN